MKSINLKFNKSTSFRYVIFVLSLSSLSCVFTEAIMPEQNFIVSFEKNSTGMSFVTRIKVNIWLYGFINVVTKKEWFVVKVYFDKHNY